VRRTVCKYLTFMQIIISDGRWCSRSYVCYCNFFPL